MTEDMFLQPFLTFGTVEWELIPDRTILSPEKVLQYPPNRLFSISVGYLFIAFI